MAASCNYVGAGDGCSFRLNNNNVTRLTTALPQLENLLLGHPCHRNTCATTVAYFLPISVQCLNLGRLEIHFNTTDIAGDFESALGGPRFQDTHSIPKSRLQLLCVKYTSLSLEPTKVYTVVDGLTNAFPCLECVEAHGHKWNDISKKLSAIN